MIPAALAEFVAQSYGPGAPMDIPDDFASIPPGVPVDGSQTIAQRDRAVLGAMLGGQLPPRLLQWQRVTYGLRIGGREVQCAIDVSPDWLGVGSDTFYLRTPLQPSAFQRVADAADAMICTKVAVLAIHDAQAPVRVGFAGMSPAEGESRNSLRLWLASNATLESVRRGAQGLTTDGKKDVIVGPTQARNPGKVCIFGAWRANGSQVQSLSTIHSASYVDYSQCERLMRRTMLVDGAERSVEDVARDATLWPCIVESRLPSRAALRYP